ncbi:MAG: DNA polymerase Y family protein [Comamonadaceae bacterium]|nr:MAG: DNA polymerase Y family protein [Comamonadaceae bacterium]
MPCWIALQTCTTEPALAGTPDNGALQRAVASLALGFTPRVALVDEAVLLDVTGSLRLFGGLHRLMELLETCIADFCRTLQAAVQSGRAQGATSLIALGRLRFMRASPETARVRVADLPMHALSAARPHLAVLERIGCRTWDDLLRLPRDGMARRFDTALLEALDRARGKVPDDYAWQVLPEHFEQKLELHALVEDATALMAGVEVLLIQLHAWLLGRQSGLSALRLVWHLDKRSDVAPTGEIDIRTAQPAQDLRHVARLIAEHLARENLPAPVHSLTLRSLVTERVVDAAAATRSLLMEARQKGDGIVELVERLSARLGDAQVQAWQPAFDHRPEAMQRWVSARSAMGALQSMVRGAMPTDRGRPGRKKAAPAAQNPRIDALYPSWLLPQPLRLQSVGDSPVYQGRLARVSGPQRLEASGWLHDGESQADLGKTRKEPAVMRDYFIYRSEQGALLWIFSERLSTAVMEAQRRDWYLHGVFA